MKETIRGKGGDITINPVRHASLVISYLDHVIYVDPVGSSSDFEAVSPPTAVLITHGHSDHLDTQLLSSLAGKPRILTNQEAFEKLTDELRSRAEVIGNGSSSWIDGFRVQAVPAHNVTPDRFRYHPPGVGNGYVLDLGGELIYVAGDTEMTEAMRSLRGIAVAFMPMNLPYTMSPSEAIRAIRSFKPRIVYPYHYKGSDLSGLQDLEVIGTEIRIRNWYPPVSAN